MQLNGKAANQVVPHVHIHIVPRWHGDGLTYLRGSQYLETWRR